MYKRLYEEQNKIQSSGSKYTGSGPGNLFIFGFESLSLLSLLSYFVYLFILYVIDLSFIILFYLC